MGQKVHPTAFRLGGIRTWASRWFSDKQFGDYLHRDIKIRKFLEKRLPDSGVAKIDIARSGGSATVTLFTSKPGVVIGRSGANIEKLRTDLRMSIQENIDLKVQEVRKSELIARLVAESIARQVEKRISYRRAAKMAIQRAREAGAEGVKIIVSGRLNGADIARSETFLEGKIPLHTLRADIDYYHEMSKTTYGAIGVKVWIFRGLVFEGQADEMLTAGAEEHAQ
jgi:small subunit ribosomal protein S3